MYRKKDMVGPGKQLASELIYLCVVKTDSWAGMLALRDDITLAGYTAGAYTC